eukprot:TRINITY_DN34596_c0_g1_i1.p1 TRINITY_DN34596_c0_g1~~TRINITY_DN34596_c0_g1_i1.p1  ORF type:complete len:384 (+),score=109.96 TRINITY_DN34596_c0_g1_i1:62-1153(+)
MEEQVLDTLDVLRNTVEYKAAWEVELWKKREQTQYAAKLEGEAKKAVSQRLDILKERERELSDEYKMKMRSATKTEDKALREQAETREKRQLLSEVEKALRRRKEELEREYSLRAKEWEDKIRRNKEEAAHKISMEQMKLKQQSATIDDLRKRLHDVETKHKELWNTVSKSKQMELDRHPASFIKEAVAEVEDKHRQVTEARRGEWLAREQSMQKKISGLTTVNTRLRELLNNSSIEILGLKEKLSKLTADTTLLTAETITLTKTKQSSTEPVPPVQSVDNSVHIEIREAVKWLPPVLADVRPACLSESDRQIILEISRLGKEKERLLSTGCYTEADSVLVSLTQQQQKMIHQLMTVKMGRVA